MSVQVTVSVSFESDTVESAEAEIKSWGLPAGAFVSSQASVPVTAGVVDEGGDIVPPSAPVIEEAPPEQPADEPPAEEPAP